MKKLILNSVLSSLIFFGVGFFVIKGFAALSNVSSGTPLTASNWNNMISNFFWGSGSGGIYYNGGKVSIGTTTPQAGVALNVSGIIMAENNIHTRGSLGGLIFRDRSNNGQLWQWYSQAGLSYLWHNNGSTQNTPLAISSLGNVGIGTASPTSKLDVNGVITGLPVYGRRGASNANNGTTTPDYYIWTGEYVSQSGYFSRSGDNKAIIVSKSGTYIIMANVLMNTISSRCDGSITINGSPISHSLSPGNSNGFYKHHFSEIITLNAGDAIRIYAANSANCQIYSDNNPMRNSLLINKIN